MFFVKLLQIMTHEIFINYMNKWDIPEWYYSIDGKPITLGICLRNNNGLYSVYDMHENGKKYNQINFRHIEDAYFYALILVKNKFIRNQRKYTKNTIYQLDASLKECNILFRRWKKWKKEKNKKDNRNRFLSFVRNLLGLRKAIELDYLLIRNE